jgi:PilZ domain
MRSHGSCIEGISINLSEGGIYLFAAANLSLGTQIEVEFRPPDGREPVRASGTVRRRVLYLYAIEFLRDDAELRPERQDRADRPPDSFNIFP